MDYRQSRSPGRHGATLRGKASSASGVVATTIGLWLSGFPIVASAQESRDAAASLVLDQVTVIDVEHGTLVPDQRVVIAGNRIQAVGARGRINLPKGAQVVEARGKYLIPGLWDLHTHPDTLSAFYPLFIAHGVTGIRDAYAFISVKTQVQWWHEILAGTRVGPPRQLLAGRPVMNIGRYRGTQLDVEGSKRLMDSVWNAGSNFLKVYPFTFERAAAARQLGLPFGGHIHGAISAAEASDSGIRVVDHVNSSGGLDRLCTGNRATLEDCRPVAETFKRNGTWWVPTLVVHARHHQFDSRLPASMPIYNRLAKLVRDFWTGSTLIYPGNWLRDSSSAGTAGIPRPDSTADSLGFLRIAQRVGMPILTGTDMGSPDVMKMLPGFSVHTELAMLVAEGLTPLNALQSATLNPAKMLRATDSLGTVSAGKLADLVLLDANPLADITNTTMIRAVVANGRYFDRAALDKLLTEIEGNRSSLVRSTADTLSR